MPVSEVTTGEPKDGEPSVLRIVHTNDFHDTLSETAANRLRDLLLESSEPGLLLDAGDAGGSGNLTFRPGGEQILERMSELGYDAMTVGNRDFHLTRMGFCAKLSRAKFPVLCANVFPAPMPALDARGPIFRAEKALGLPVHRYIVREVNGWRVVVFGLTVPMITERMLSRKVSAYVFESPIPCAARIVPMLRAEYTPDLVVALTHIGFTRDQELAAAVPGIDLIIGGHSHTVLENGVRAGGAMLVQAGSRGRYAGVVEVERGGGADRVVQLRASLVPL